MNLVSIIMQMLTPDLLGKLTSGLGGGLSQSIVQKAVGAAIPAILSGLTGIAGQSGGGSLITKAISKLDPGMMGNLASVLGGSGQGALATTGTNILGSLLGNSAVGTIAGALGKYAGLSGPASTGLLKSPKSLACRRGWRPSSRMPPRWPSCASGRPRRAPRASGLPSLPG